MKISRDFDLQRLIGQDIAAMAQLFEDNVIDREEFRDMLVQGEILPSAAEQPTKSLNLLPSQLLSQLNKVHRKIRSIF